MLPPESFDFKHAKEWPKWIRCFDCFNTAFGLDEKEPAVQINALIYAIRDSADDILASSAPGGHKTKQTTKTVRDKFQEQSVV